MSRIDPHVMKTLRWLVPPVLWLVPPVLLLVLQIGVATARNDRAFQEDAGSEYASLDCLVQPAKFVELGSPVAGVIEEIEVERGDAVEKGQLLVRLEAGVERATVELARARSQMESEVRASEVSLGLDQRRVERKDRMFERRAVSIDAKDEAETEAQLAELQLKQAQENRRMAELELVRARSALRRRAIYSPFSGVVVDRMLEPGARAGDQPVLKVARLDPLRVEVIAPAHLFGKIQKGMRAAIATEMPVGGVFDGTVKTVDPMVDAASGRFGVELELPNPDLAIPAGLRCRVDLLSG